MPSTRASSKRKVALSPAAVADGRNSKRRRNHAQRVGLLDLPVEVRCIILKELLCRSEPIKFQSLLYRRIHNLEEYLQTQPPRILWPEILATCNQLCLEGTGILYSNTFGCWAGNIDPAHDDNQHPFPRVLAGKYYADLDMVPQNAVMCLPTIAFQFYVHPGKTELSRLRSSARRFARILRRTDHRWDHVKIQLVCSHALGPQQSFDKALEPFCHIRKMRDVEISGTTDAQYGQDLARQMMSNSPVCDLDAMKESLNRFMQSFMDVDEMPCMRPTDPAVEAIWDKFYECCDAAEEMQTKSFQQRRREIMQMIGAFLLVRQEKIFENDPEDWEPDLALTNT